MESLPSIWLLMHSWLTPAVLFVLLNLVIGTIALTSKSLLAHRHPNDPAGNGENYGIARTASSALHRLRSISLTRLRSGDFFFDPSISTAVQHKTDEISEISSETKVSEKESEQQSAAEEGSKATMYKSAREQPEVRTIERRKDVKTEKAVEEEVEDGVDARADDFINRFRQQLHLQRLDSLLKYKDMLSRGR
ncbi:hypothetical protein KSP39_PZI005855 [Platanthera zijinensis]|uniref:DUF4408 domain-containing protein n=1 Tax=Platanthera zijinensis TaxID=2320716 RepID=A0AAP0BS21_9ASPA